jgi:predicted ATPase
MLNNITFENYKAFKKGVFKIKPLTILLGANSSGKSSLLQLILLLEQTLNLDEFYDSAVKLNGKYINLGEDENIIRNRDHKKEVTFEFELSNTSFNKELKKIRSKIQNQLTEILIILFYANDFPNKLSHEKILPKLINSNFLNSKNINEFELLNRIDELLKELKAKDLNAQHFRGLWFKSNLRFFLRRGYDLNIESILDINIQEFKDALELFRHISKLRFRNVRFGYRLKYSNKTKKIEVIENYIIVLNKKLLSIIVDENKNISKIDSDLLDKKLLIKYSKSINSLFYFTSLKLNLMKNIDNTIFKNVVLENIFNIYSKLFNILTEEFNSENINYVAPLRAFPQRYYFLDEANANLSLNIYSGNNLAEILKRDSNVNKLVNKWLGKFGLGVSVKEFKDIIHNIKVKQNGLDLDIIDVGFGISQILPILIQGFMTEKKSINIIEQPEIHLHPKMQASLADLFIDIIYNNSNQSLSGKSLVIETHSEYILRRIRRRISEGKINSNDVALYFIEPRQKQNGSAKIKKINISKNGAFDWPKDFYETELEDNLAFLNNFSNK